MSDTGIKTVPGQIFASINFRGLGFIHECSENLYTAKISMYTVCTLHYSGATPILTAMYCNRWDCRYY